MKNRRLIVALVIGVLLGAGVGEVSAHGFGERYDLPIPLSYFLVGAAAVVALSFLLIGLIVQRRSTTFDYPRHNLLGPGWLSAALTNPVILTSIRLVAVAVFVLVVATAFFGTQSPDENLSPTMVWILWWVGMGYASALLGNLWALVNPWKIVYEWGERLMEGGSGRGETGMFKYPERWDVWPAAVLFLVFAWLENVYADSAQPVKLGTLILLYSAITCAGMLAFGKSTWLRHGEAFSVLFGFFARFSPTEVRVGDGRMCRSCELDCYASDGGCVDCYRCFEAADPEQRRLNLRPFAVGLTNPARVSAATAVFVVMALATVTFDGLTATSSWLELQTSVYSTLDVFGSNTITAIDTTGLVLLPLVFLAVYLAFSWAIRQLSGEATPVSDVAKGFVFSLVPIALAYNMAHFLSLLAIQGQLIIPLISDPFGFGWDLFGTGDYRVNIAVMNAKIVWYVSVAAIVLGHIISIFIAHVISLRRVPIHAKAQLGQYPMMVLMVSYTATSLWIIAQPIVAGA